MDEIRKFESTKILKKLLRSRVQISIYNFLTDLQTVLHLGPKIRKRKFAFRVKTFLACFGGWLGSRSTFLRPLEVSKRVTEAYTKKKQKKTGVWANDSPLRKLPDFGPPFLILGFLI